MIFTTVKIHNLCSLNLSDSESGIPVQALKGTDTVATRLSQTDQSLPFWSVPVQAVGVQLFIANYVLVGVLNI